MSRIRKGLVRSFSDSQKWPTASRREVDSRVHGQVDGHLAVESVQQSRWCSGTVDTVTLLCKSYFCFFYLSYMIGSVVGVHHRWQSSDLHVQGRRTGMMFKISICLFGSWYFSTTVSSGIRSKRFPRQAALRSGSLPWGSTFPRTSRRSENWAVKIAHFILFVSWLLLFATFWNHLSLCLDENFNSGCLQWISLFSMCRVSIKHKYILKNDPYLQQQQKKEFNK